MPILQRTHWKKLTMIRTTIKRLLTRTKEVEVEVREAQEVVAEVVDNQEVVEEALVVDVVAQETLTTNATSLTKRWLSELSLPFLYTTNLYNQQFELKSQHGV